MADDLALDAIEKRAERAQALASDDADPDAAAALDTLLDITLPKLIAAVRERDAEIERLRRDRHATANDENEAVHTAEAKLAAIRDALEVTNQQWPNLIDRATVRRILDSEP